MEVRGVGALTNDDDDKEKDMDKLKNVGDRITVNECDWLGTPEVMGTIRKVYKEHYIVHCDGDEPEWDGPVSFKGDVICDMP